jgi:hypothetical protein
MANDIPVADIVVGSLNRVFKNLPQVFTIGLLPLIVFFAIILFGSLLGLLARAPAIGTLAAIIGYFVLGCFALAWMRVVLQGDKGDASRAKLAFSPADQKYWGYYSLLIIPVFLLGIISLLLQAAGWTGTIVGLFLTLVVVGLYSTVQLVFPAAAVGEPTSLDTAWQQGMHILGSVVGANLILALVVALPMLLIDFVLGQLAFQLGQSAGIGGVVVVVIIAAIVFTPIYLIGLALLSTAACLVYRRVVPGAVVS